MEREGESGWRNFVWRVCSVLQLLLVSKGTQFLDVITPAPPPAVYTPLVIPNHSKTLGSSQPILEVSEEVKCAVLCAPTSCSLKHPLKIKRVFLIVWLIVF